MNRVILMGRLTREPDIRYSAGENATAVARYTLAVDRQNAKLGEFYDPYHPALLALLAHGIDGNHQIARKKRLPLPRMTRLCTTRYIVIDR